MLDETMGEIIRDGFKIAIIGPPNAGKSSFLNLLVKRQAAIVSSIKGTTRDIIEVKYHINNYPVILTDTAGIRNAKNKIEKTKKNALLSCFFPLADKSFKVSYELKESGSCVLRYIGIIYLLFKDRYSGVYSKI